MEIQNLSKTFTGQKALDRVCIDVQAGEVHALVGRNGSGKSTLAKILSGFHAPDPGAQARLFDREVTFPLAGEDRRRFHCVHQDLGLVDSLSVLDNIGLSATFQTDRIHRIDWRHSRERARSALEPFGLGDLNLSVPLNELTASERTIVAIARGLIGWDGEAGLLVLDETTAALPPQEVMVLQQAMERATAQGAGILYITHRLDEVFSFGDRVSVLRDGRMMGTYATSGLGQEDLVALMVGSRDVEREAVPAIRDEVVLSCEHLSADGLSDVSLTVRSGEIVGVAGLLGSGRECIADVLFGATPLKSGVIRLRGKRLVRRSPARSLKQRIVLVPSDRTKRAIFPAWSVRENVTLPKLRTLLRKGRISRPAEDGDVQRWIDLVGLLPPDPQRTISTLSGGNQQKTVLARALRLQPEVLILDEATQGVDVAAKRSIHNLIRKAASEGAAVLVCTAEAEDLPRLCHRVVLLSEGRVVKEFSEDRLTQENLLLGVTAG
jgi:ribose transport system ATP-binding protein